MAGTERIELPLTEPESVVLPLDDVPIGVVLCASTREDNIRECARVRKPHFEKSLETNQSRRTSLTERKYLKQFSCQNMSVCFGRIVLSSRIRPSQFLDYLK